MPAVPGARPHGHARLTRIRARGRVPVDMAVRAPQLHLALRAFVLGAFAYLLRELEDDGDSLPFAFEEHGGAAGPALYEYRPLVRDFVEARAGRLRGREDATIALDELVREPAAGIYARAYAAVAPLVGITTGIQRELGAGVRVRAAADGELARHWPEASGLLPSGFGREPDRYCVIELLSALGNGEDVPDSPAEIADAVSAIRLATAAPLAAGPVLFETLDGRPYGIRPVLPIAATQPPGEPTRLDEFRGPLAAELLVRLGLADADTHLAEALDRWELSLFQHEPFRSEQLRSALGALLGGTWPLRASVLLEEEPERRQALHRDLTALENGAEATSPAATAVRRALVEVLREGDRAGLVDSLDRMLLGLSVPDRLRVAS